MESKFLILRTIEHTGIKVPRVFSVDGQNVFDRERALDIIAVEMEKWVDVFIGDLGVTESRFWEMVRQMEIGYGEDFIFSPIQDLGVKFEMIELHEEAE